MGAAVFQRRCSNEGTSKHGLRTLALFFTYPSDHAVALIGAMPMLLPHILFTSTHGMELTVATMACRGCWDYQVWFQEMHAALPEQHQDTLQALYLVHPQSHRIMTRAWMFVLQGQHAAFYGKVACNLLPN
jgi:hypothetical protein